MSQLAWLLLLSAAFQLAAAVRALSYIRLTGRRMSWILISAALLIMCARRFIPFIMEIKGKGCDTCLAHESLGMILSILMMAGVFGIGPLFQKIRESEKALELQVNQKLDEIRRMDGILQLQGRQAAMGEMIGCIAHQWRQPLSALSILIQNYRYHQPPAETEFLLQQEAQGLRLIDHMNHTIDDFRNFYKPEQEKKQFRLSEALSETLALVKNVYEKSGIRIETIVKDDPPVIGFRNEISQVILILLGNARDALLTAGKSEKMIRIEISGSGNEARMVISDNAGGIPAALLKKLGTPYITTKTDGTGIGLFMAKRILEKDFGGTLTAVNENGGARFEISIRV